MREFSFPYVSVGCGADIADNVTLMVLGGRKPSVPWLSAAASGHSVWAVDSGVDVCFEAGIVPERLIGDADSAEPEAWQWAMENGAAVSKYGRDKDLTDFQIALDIFSKGAEPKGRSVFLTGCFGGRFDHLWSVIISFLNFGDGYIPVGMADDREGMLFLGGPSALELDFGKIPEAISLVSFSQESCGVSLTGVRWPLDDAVLKYLFPYSISNRIENGSRVSVSLRSGTLGVYWEWAQ